MSTKDGIRKQQQQAAKNGELSGAGAGNREASAVPKTAASPVDRSRSPAKPARK